MNKEELQTGIADIRKALEVVQGRLEADENFDEAVRDLGLAVGNVRRSTWAVLTSAHSDNYENFLARLRVRRATETCEDVLSDLYADTVVPTAPGLDLFHAALRELARACKEAAP